MKLGHVLRAKHMCVLVSETDMAPGLTLLTIRQGRQIFNFKKVSMRSVLQRRSTEYDSPIPLGDFLLPPKRRQYRIAKEHVFTFRLRFEFKPSHPSAGDLGRSFKLLKPVFL